jgi:hypothetical protein
MTISAMAWRCRFFERKLHVVANATRDEQTVHLTRRCNELDSESSQVPADRAEDIHVRLAGIATAALTRRRRSDRPKKNSQFLVRAAVWRSSISRRFAEQQIFAPPHRHLMIDGLRDCFGRTCLNLIA